MCSLHSLFLHLLAIIIIINPYTIMCVCKEGFVLFSLLLLLGFVPFPLLLWALVWADRDVVLIYRCLAHVHFKAGTGQGGSSGVAKKGRRGRCGRGTEVRPPTPMANTADLGHALTPTDMANTTGQGHALTPTSMANTAGRRSRHRRRVPKGVATEAAPGPF